MSKAIYPAIVVVTLSAAVIYYSQHNGSIRTASVEVTPTVHSTSPSLQLKSQPFQKISALKKKRQETSSTAKRPMKDEARDLFYSAKKIQMSNPVRAEAMLKEAIEKDPNNSAYWADLASMSLAKKSPDEARKYAEECLAIDDKNSTCHMVLVSSYTRDGDWDSAYPVLRDCLTLDTTNVHCLGGMTSYYLATSNLAEAKNQMDRLVSLDPDSMWTHLAEGSYYNLAGQPDLAIQHFQVACNMGQPFACSTLKKLNAAKSQ